MKFFQKQISEIIVDRQTETCGLFTGTFGYNEELEAHAYKHAHT